MYSIDFFVGWMRAMFVGLLSVIITKLVSDFVMSILLQSCRACVWLALVISFLSSVKTTAICSPEQLGLPGAFLCAGKFII